MKVVPIGFPGRLDMRCEKREEIQMTPKISPTRKMELPCSEMGKTIVRVGLGQEQKFSFGTS